ncbi:MAG: pantoate--beta-alanine ligase [Flavobacteriales bacterium CG_4_9_14_3_um_filter_40_17]|nr:MAG: pantoate--beta-alanine ligase [Flavobacteriales bacterium CG_4_9_14_3_um_filter_40_17]
MVVFDRQVDLSVYIKERLKTSQSLGLVPTMGALHEGHLSIVRKALATDQYVVVSIFVNPTQFDNPNDLKNYPRILNADLENLASIDAERIVVYTPTVEDVYGSNPVSENINLGGLDLQMEGKFRKGHFQGVATVVKKLFEIIKPQHAYFGEKDFQQLQIIRYLAKSFQLPVQIIGCEIYREANGLAMSSRNRLLSEEDNQAAGCIFQSLMRAKEVFQIKTFDEIKQQVNTDFENHELYQLEYFEIAESETLAIHTHKHANKKYRGCIAVFAGSVRLIDNIPLN